MCHTVTCPGGWHQYKLGCFYVSKNETDQQTARMSCQEMQADLVSINDQEEMDFVKNIT